MSALDSQAATSSTAAGYRAVSWAARVLLQAGPVLLFLASSIFLFRQSIFEGRVFFQNDTLLFYNPIARVIDGALDEGRLPLWTPYIYSGHPLFADGEAGMLYPPNLLAYLLLPIMQASVLLRVLRFFLAALFTYLYGRSLGLQRPAATISGLAFAFGSFMVGQLHHSNVGNTSLWLPLMLASIEWSLRARRARHLACLVLAGAALGWAALTVHANALAMMLALFVLYVPFRLFLSPDAARGGFWSRLRRTLLIIGLPVATGLALGAVQLLPLWELATFSRGQGVAYDFATGFAMPPLNAVTLLFPYFFRDSGEGYWSPWFRWDTTVYVGIAPLLLAILAVVFVRRRVTLFYAAIALVGLLLAFGDYSPIRLYSLLYQLPVFSFLRGPARFIYWTTFALAILAGLGAQGLSNHLSMRKAAGTFEEKLTTNTARQFRLFYVALSIFAVALVAILYGVRYVMDIAPDRAKDLLQGYLSLRGANLERTLARDPFAALRNSLDPLSEWTMRSLVALAIACVLLWGWQRWPTPRRLWQAALIVLVAADLLSFAGRFHPTTAIATVQAAGPAGQFLQQHGGFDRVLTLWPAFDTWPDRLLPLRISEAGGYSSLTPRRQEIFLGRARQGASSFLSLLDVRYVIAARGFVPPWLQAQQPVFEEGNVLIFERAQHLPRAFIARDIRIGNPERVLAALSDATFDPRHTIWLEEPPPALASPSSEADGEGIAEVVSYSAESVTVQAETPVPAMLVLTDSFYPGWAVWVDGYRLPLYRADYLFRAVSLTPGRHTVRFVFEPLSVRLGAGISLLAALCILTLFGLAIRRPSIARRTASPQLSQPAES